MKLTKDKNQIVEFQIEIEGTQEKITPRLLLRNDLMTVMFEGKMQGKNAVFEVSKLDKMFEGAKDAQGEIEVIVEGRYFKPWKSIVEFDVPVKVTVTESAQLQVIEPRVRVEAKPADPKKYEKPTIVEGQQKIKINGKLFEVFVTKVLKENGKTILNVVDDKGKQKKIRVK